MSSTVSSTYNNVKGSEAGVEAGRENLRAAEENVLLNAATAYMNVVRDQAIVELRKNNVKVLAEQLRATEDRYKVGEVTKTDLAQAQSGLAQGQADLSIAQGTLYGDQALFAQFIGHPPRALKDPGPPEKLLPKTLQRAIDITGAENPGLISAIFQERAQQHVVKQLKGQLLPSLTANASYTKSGQPFGVPEASEENDTLVFGQLNVPIYQAGSVSAQIRQAIESLSQARQQIDAQRELARQNVSSQWGLVIAARGNIAAGKSAVEATRIALEGVREEERVGQRTILDVLNSEQQNLNAQVNLVSFQRDLVVASYGVLARHGAVDCVTTSLFKPSFTIRRVITAKSRMPHSAGDLRLKAPKTRALPLSRIPGARRIKNRPTDRPIRSTCRRSHKRRADRSRKLSTLDIGRFAGRLAVRKVVAGACRPIGADRRYGHIGRGLDVPQQTIQLWRG